MEEIRPGRYRHFKGNEYEVLGTARHSETGEEMVVYRALYGDHGLWVRPASMWNETVERDGRTCKRFTYMDDDVPAAPAASCDAVTPSPGELSPTEKKHLLYLRQKETLDGFLERGAISQAQYDKSFGDLTEKMGMKALQ